MEDPPITRKPCCVCGEAGGKHCTKCKCRHYCSKKCQLVDWYDRGHKAQCKQLAAEFQDRILDSLTSKKIKVAPAWGGTCAICFDLLTFGGGKTSFNACCCTTLCSPCFVKCRQYDTRCPLCMTPAHKSDAEWRRRIQKHVDAGNADAQEELGDVSHATRQPSLQRAAQMYELAAAQGHVRCQLKLGLLYEAGDGVIKNLETAVLWFRRAADQGFPEAQLILGLAFIDGSGVAKSNAEGLRWLRLAAAQGLVQARIILDGC